MTMTKTELQARVADLEKSNRALLVSVTTANTRADNSRGLLESQRTHTARLTGWQECAREFMHPERQTVAHVGNISLEDIEK